jgi:hypothetical protein
LVPEKLGTLVDETAKYQNKMNETEEIWKWETTLKEKGRSGLGSKGSCYVPYKKNQKNPFLTFCMGHCKGPCDQRRIATMASSPLENNNISEKRLVFQKKKRLVDLETTLQVISLKLNCIS